MRNTVLLNLYGLIFSFPAAIILALMINEVRMQRFKKLVQTVSYMPYFISTVAVCGLITTFLSSDGLITMAIKALTGNSYALLTDAGAFRSIYIISDIWQPRGLGQHHLPGGAVRASTPACTRPPRSTAPAACSRRCTCPCPASPRSSRFSSC